MNISPNTPQPLPPRYWWLKRILGLFINEAARLLRWASVDVHPHASRIGPPPRPFWPTVRPTMC
jgi:hypothetical protein